MSDTPTTPPAAPPAVQVDWKALLGMLWSILPTGILKTALGVFLGIYGGYAYVRSDVGAVIEKSAPNIRDWLPPRKQKPADAITMLRGDGWMCSGTIAGPIDAGDKTVDILTAAHCIKVGQSCRVHLKDGRILAPKCVTRDANADVAWLRAERPDGDIPYLLMADVPPPPGTPVWHQGYGIDKPNSKEDGTVSGFEPKRNQVRFRMSVSPGDSGGGIIVTADNRIVSPVCCTTKLAGVGDVWGGAPAAAAAIRPKRNTSFDEPPVVHPILEFDVDPFDERQKG